MGSAKDGTTSLTNSMVHTTPSPKGVCSSERLVTASVIGSFVHRKLPVVQVIPSRTTFGTTSMGSTLRLALRPTRSPVVPRYSMPCSPRR